METLYEFSIVKAHFFKEPERFKHQKGAPPGFENADGYCLRAALSRGGLETNLPTWVSSRQLPAICRELGLKLQLRPTTVVDGKPYVVGYISGDVGDVIYGHFVFTRKIFTIIDQIRPHDLIGIIEL